MIKGRVGVAVIGGAFSQVPWSFEAPIMAKSEGQGVREEDGEGEGEGERDVEQSKG